MDRVTKYSCTSFNFVAIEKYNENKKVDEYETIVCGCFYQNKPINILLAADCKFYDDLVVK
jgi:hypothetical protein